MRICYDAFFIVFVIQISVAKKFNCTNTFRSPTPPPPPNPVLQLLTRGHDPPKTPFEARDCI